MLWCTKQNRVCSPLLSNDSLSQNTPSDSPDGEEGGASALHAERSALQSQVE